MKQDRFYYYLQSLLNRNMYNPIKSYFVLVFLYKLREWCMCVKIYKYKQGEFQLISRYLYGV